MPGQVADLKAHLGSLPDVPEALLRRTHSLIADLHGWEVAAAAAPEAERMDRARETYRALLTKHRAEPRTPQPIAYGGDPAHDPEKETVVDSGIEDALALVLTSQPGRLHFMPPVFHLYEYEKRDDDWALVALDYVDQDGCYPSL